MTKLFDLDANRVIDAVGRTEGVLATLPSDTITELDETAQLDQEMWLALGGKPTRFYLEGKLTLGEAQSLHVIHSEFDDMPLAERMVFIKTMRALMEESMEGRE